MRLQVLSSASSALSAVKKTLIQLSDSRRKEQAAVEICNDQRVPSQLLQAVLDSPFEGVVVIDDQGMTQHFSRANEPFCGITAEDAVGRHIHEVVPTSSLPEVARRGKPVLGEMFNMNGRKVMVNDYPTREGKLIIGAVGKMISHNLMPRRSSSFKPCGGREATEPKPPPCSTLTAPPCISGSGSTGWIVLPSYPSQTLKSHEEGRT